MYSVYLDGIFAKNKGINMKTWQCIVCGFIYDEAKGLPEDGIAPGTVWADVPANWECPDCGVSKSDFEMVQI
jgi:rubredoxin